MSSNKRFAALLILGLSGASCAASPHRFECPAVLTDGKTTHAFAQIELFDKPPQNNGSLMPAETDYGVKWSVSENADIYMVCGYSGTDKTITVHAPGVSLCKGTQSPLAAFCD
ncbi:STY0301 family protein [Dyella mobilis]|uniref:Lipoprotein n=1 Tax=Dyella mobilis TaxID=1849582 RepID=A0ABS2KJY8_9GAMM|nr:STY0301 family protein [Dyella mobilis]MBM7131254.1 hypothetical protein [Dyella mobilis]GLQ98809.1 hypothetical protein GCM10007863_32290 [Dyella mobilis]